MALQHELVRREHAQQRHAAAAARRVALSRRLGDGDLFWNVYLWHGYGESLTDYNDSVTRIGVGFALSP